MEKKSSWPLRIMTGWWFQTLWKIWVRQLGRLFPIYGKIKFMFQTTNQMTKLWRPWDLRILRLVWSFFCWKLLVWYPRNDVTNKQKRIYHEVFGHEASIHRWLVLWKIWYNQCFCKSLDHLQNTCAIPVAQNWSIRIYNLPSGKLR